MKQINLELLATRKFTSTISTEDFLLEADVIKLRIKLPASVLDSKLHRLSIRTPMAEDVETAFIPAVEDGGSKYLSLLLDSSTFKTNDKYFISYENEDGVGANCLSLDVTALAVVPEYAIPYKLPVASVDFVNLKIVELVEGIKNLYYDTTNGKLCFVKADGSEFIVDMPIEKVVTALAYNTSTRQITLTFADATTLVITLPLAVKSGVGEMAGLITADEKLTLSDRFIQDIQHNLMFTVICNETEFAGLVRQPNTVYGVYDVTDSDRILVWHYGELLYLVTYTLDGGTNDPLNPATFFFSNLPIDLGPAIKSGFYFDGWFTEAEFTNEVTQITTVGDKALFAKFLTAYSITYEENGGDTVADMVDQIALPDPLPACVKTGYTFDGWFTDLELTTPAVAGATLSANATLYAKWTVI